MLELELDLPTTGWWNEGMVRQVVLTRSLLAITSWWTTMRVTQSLNTSSTLNLTARLPVGFVHMTKVLYVTDVQIF